MRGRERAVWALQMAGVALTVALLARALAMALHAWGGGEWSW